MPHCRVSTAHKDLRGAKCRMARRARQRRPSPPARAWPAAAHLCLTARAPAQGAHRLLAPRLSRRREIRRLFALKIHPCGTRASIARGSRADDLPYFPLPGTATHLSGSRSRCRPTHDSNVPPQPPSLSLAAPAALPAQRLRHQRAPRGIRTVSGSFKEPKDYRSCSCSARFSFTKMKSRDICLRGSEE